MMMLNFSMFGVALPVIRDAFNIQTNIAAWLVIVYTAPFMILPPLYGRMGDGLGKRQVLLIGIVTFLVGTVVTLLATQLGFLMVGRAIQGLGAAGIIPLSIAIISQYFPAGEQGKALGTWNSVAPTMHMIGPLLAGLLIDYLSWRTIFGPVMVVGLVALWIVRRQIPAEEVKAPPNFLRSFDWGGIALFTITVTGLIFYLSSKAITGVTPLQDWRLLGMTLLLAGAFIYWEKHHTHPFVALNIFADKTFGRASFCAAARMFAMSGIGFLMPLYLADIHGLSAASTGILLTIHAGALLITLRVGGQLADRWTGRWPITGGMTMQVTAMISFALLPASVAIWVVGGVIMFHGFGAGLSLAPLHRATMGNIAADQKGIAAGLYSLIRFGGTLLGPALAGVVLQQGLDRFLQPITAYHIVFWLIAGVAVLGVVLGWKLQE
jgi:MFS family permease